MIPSAVRDALQPANGVPPLWSTTIMKSTLAPKWRAAAGLVCMVLASASAYCAPKAVKASYGGFINGLAVGIITEHFEVNDSAYRIVSDTKPTGLAVLAQRQPPKFSSTGQLTREGLKPSHFEARRTGADQPQVAADFDWARGTLVLKHDGKVESLPVLAGTQDRLSIMYQFMFMPFEKARYIDFAMTNGRKLDRYRYHVTPDVEIDTPLGRLKTLHLVKQRDADDSAAELWLSPQHHHLPVRMLFIERNGMRLEQIIQSLEFRE